MDDSKTARDFFWCGEESFGEKNYLVAVENFEKAAKLGDADAMEKLAYMYTYNIGVDRDIAKAVHYLEKAADIFYNDELDFNSGRCIKAYVQAAYFGSKYACDKVADIYLESLIAQYLEPDIFNDKYHFFAESSKAMEDAGDIDRYTIYSVYERQGKYGDKYQLSGDQFYFICMGYAAKLGNAKAMAELAFMYREGLVCSDIKYREGLGIHKDKNKSDRWYLIALRCFERVADFLLENKIHSGETPSILWEVECDTYFGLCQLAEINLLGDTSEQDGYEAIEMYAKVVKLRNSDELSEDAIKKVAEIYRDGKGGVIPEGKKAINLFTRVYKSGDKSALTEIAKICRDGLGGVIPDGNKAIELFNKSYENGDKSDSEIDSDDLGNTLATKELAKIYKNGVGGVEKNEALTTEWLENSRNIIEIAEMYRDGVEVKRNGAKAVEYFTKAATLGDTYAMKELAKIYRHGLDNIEKNLEKSNEWILKMNDLEPYGIF